MEFSSRKLWICPINDINKKIPIIGCKFLFIFLEEYDPPDTKNALRTGGLGISFCAIAVTN